MWNIIKMIYESYIEIKEDQMNILDQEYKIPTSFEGNHQDWFFNNSKNFW